MNSPSGSSIISGQTSQSLNTSSGSPIEPDDARTNKPRAVADLEHNRLDDFRDIASPKIIKPQLFNGFDCPELIDSPSYMHEQLPRADPFGPFGHPTKQNHGCAAAEQ